MDILSEELKNMNEDMVSSPKHYNFGDIETIDVIKTFLSPEEFKGYLKGNILKYRERHSYKGQSETDLKKAKWHFDRLQEELGKTYWEEVEEF